MEKIQSLIPALLSHVKFAGTLANGILFAFIPKLSNDFVSQRCE